MYAWDISYEPRSRGKSTDYRFVVDVHIDSNANGKEDANDLGAIGVMVTIEVRDAEGYYLGSISGTTDAQGVFYSEWLRGLASGSYHAKVIDLAHETFQWEELGDGLPEVVLDVP